MELRIGNYASYLAIKEFKEEMRPLKTKDMSNGIYADYDKDGELVGIEIVGVVIPSFYQDYKKEE